MAKKNATVTATPSRLFGASSERSARLFGASSERSDRRSGASSERSARLFGASSERSDVFVKAGPVEVGLAGVPAWAKGTAVVVVAGGVSAGLFRKLSR